jgi:hypothetical protein
MWRCESCGATVQREAFCAACGWPIEEAVIDIRRKVRTVRLRDGVADRWAWRGAKVGFFLGWILILVLLGCFFVIGFVRHRSWADMVDSFLAMIVFSLLFPFFVAFLFAPLFLVFGAVVKPIFMAVFCSTKRFDQEYGSTRKP